RASLAAIWARRPLLPAGYFLHPPPPRPHSYTLSLHDALPISHHLHGSHHHGLADDRVDLAGHDGRTRLQSRQSNLLQSCLRTRVDRKSTRPNSSHVASSSAVFCRHKESPTRALRSARTSREWS